MSDLLLHKLLSAYATALSSTLTATTLPLVIAALSTTPPITPTPPTVNITPTLSISLPKLCKLYSSLLLSLIANSIEELGTIVQERQVQRGLAKLEQARRRTGTSGSNRILKRSRRTLARLATDTTVGKGLQVGGLLRGMRVAAKERLLERVAAQVVEVQRKAEAEREAIQALLVEHQSLLDTASRSSMELSRVTGVVQQWNASSTKEWIDTTLPRLM